jgi:hypothetical protein
MRVGTGLAPILSVRTNYANLSFFDHLLNDQGIKGLLLSAAFFFDSLRDNSLFRKVIKKIVEQFSDQTGDIRGEQARTPTRSLSSTFLILNVFITWLDRPESGSHTGY